VTGVDRTVVRRHMSDLVSAGLVTGRPERGGRGRPKTSYEITTPGREVFFARYDVLLDCLTRGLAAQIGTARTRTIFEEAAKNLGRDLGFPNSKERVVDSLREVGFQPEVRQERGDRIMVSRNCPVFQIAQKYPALLCEAFHASLLQEAFANTEVQLRQTMARGARHCVHVLASRQGIGSRHAKQSVEATSAA
jgi:predicted ArsR family transcriptional regulator